MKTRKIIELNTNNDFEKIIEARNILLKQMYEQPFCKHTVTVPLSDGSTFKMQVCPRSETSHLDIFD